MRLFLIRHGQSTNNALPDQAQRVVDPHLTAIGVEQAQRLCDHISAHPHQFGFTHLYVSGMYRALQTAQPLARAFNLPLNVWVDVHEFGGMYLEDAQTGVVQGYAGMTRAEVTADFPETVLPEAVTDNGWYDPAMGMESVEHFVMRTVRVLNLLKKRAVGDERIAIVSHGLFLDGLMKAIFQQSPKSPSELFYLFNNTAITRFDFDEPIGDFKDRLRLHYHNRIDHLSDSLRTA